MKRAVVCLIAAIICASLWGCSLFSGNYTSITPHSGDGTGVLPAEQQASSYPQLREAVLNLIRSGSAGGVIYLADMSEDVASSYMEAAVRYVTTENALGVYAVEQIEYETGMNAGKMALAVRITYSRSRAEILKIKYAENMQQAVAAIGTALENCSGSIVVLIDSYTSTDFSQLVRQYAQNNAHLVMETPQVMSAVYPDSGETRLVELSFTYSTEQERLLELQELVRPVFLSAELYVQGASSDTARLSQLYSFLMERHAYTVVPTVTTAYSLLQDGIGDSYSFACVYATMCNQVGITARVISGTRNAEPWHWNEVQINGQSYYVDLITADRTGGFRLFTADDMISYNWIAT